MAIPLDSSVGIGTLVYRGPLHCDMEFTYPASCPLGTRLYDTIAWSGGKKYRVSELLCHEWDFNPRTGVGIARLQAMGGFYEVPEPPPPAPDVEALKREAAFWGTEARKWRRLYDEKVKQVESLSTDVQVLGKAFDKQRAAIEAALGSS